MRAALILAVLVASLAVGCSCGLSHGRPDAAADACGAPAVGCPCAPSGAFLCGGARPWGDLYCNGGEWLLSADGPCWPDAGTHDAGPAGDAFWTLEPANDRSITSRRCAEAEGASAILHVQVRLSEACLLPGPIRADVEAATRTVRVRAFAWRDHDAACTAVSTVFERDLEVTGLLAGAWHVDDGGAGIDLAIDPLPPAACTGIRPLLEGESCLATCDCDRGLSCVAIEGDAVCDSVCAFPCQREDDGREHDLGCAPERECVATTLAGFSVGTVCAARTVDACSASAACPAGMRCVTDADAPSHCVWDVELSSATRHACVTDADCETPGLDCVDHQDGSGRRCEVRCITATMRCPGSAPHACDPRGICEWLGE